MSWSIGMRTAPMATLAHNAASSNIPQTRKGKARGKKDPCAGRERGGREGMGIDLTFLAKVDGSRCGRETWLAEISAYSCATAPDFHRLRLLTCFRYS